MPERKTFRRFTALTVAVLYPSFIAIMSAKSQETIDIRGVSLGVPFESIQGDCRGGVHSLEKLCVFDDGSKMGIFGSGHVLNLVSRIEYLIPYKASLSHNLGLGAELIKKYGQPTFLDPSGVLWNWQKQDGTYLAAKCDGIYCNISLSNPKIDEIERKAYNDALQRNKQIPKL